MPPATTESQTTIMKANRERRNIEEANSRIQSEVTRIRATSGVTYAELVKRVTVQISSYEMELLAAKHFVSVARDQPWLDFIFRDFPFITLGPFGCKEFEHHWTALSA